MSEPRAFRQRFTIVGWYGAAFFVLGPSISALMLITSIPNYLEALGSRYAYNPAKELYHPALYIILQAFSLTGVALMLVGRETFEVPSSLPVGQSTADIAGVPAAAQDAS